MSLIKIITLQEELKLSPLDITSFKMGFKKYKSN